MKVGLTATILKSKRNQTARGVAYQVSLADLVTKYDVTHQVDACLESIEKQGQVGLGDLRDLAKVLATHDVYWVAALIWFLTWKNE